MPGTYFILHEAFDIYRVRYVESSVDAVGGTFRAALLAIVGVLFLAVFRKRWRSRFGREYNLVLIGAVSMISVFPVALLSSVIGDRIGYYIMPIELIILARIPYLYEGRDSMLLNFGPYAALAAVLGVWVQYSSLFAQCYVPYSSWLL